MSKELDGKVALITGGTTGIGRDAAVLFAKEGAKVVVNDLGGALTGGDEGSAGPAEQVVQQIKAAGGQAVSNSESVADYKAVARMIEQAKDTFGGLHAIVNPAGILRDGMFHKMPEADWDAVIAVHLRGSFNVTRASNFNFANDSISVYGTPAAPVATAGQPLFAPSTARFGGPRQVQLGLRAVF